MVYTPTTSGMSTQGSGSIFSHWRREETPTPTVILDDDGDLQMDMLPRDYSNEDLVLASQLFAIEDEHRSLPFETADKEGASSPKTNGEEKDLPMRTLDNFVLFDASDLSLASIDLIGSDVNVHAVGTVGPIYVEEDEADEEVEEEEATGAGVPTRSRTVASVMSTGHMTVELYLRNIVQYEFCFGDDGTVETWIQTTNAHYKLLQPTERYSGLYKDLTNCLNLITAVITLAPENAEMTLKDLLITMEEKEQAVSYADVQRMIEFIVQHLDQWMETASSTKSKAIERSKTYYELNKLSGVDLEIAPKKAFPSPARRITGRTILQKKPKNINSAVLLHQNETTVTNWVHQLSAGMFGRALNVLGTDTAEVENLTCDPASAKYKKPQRKLREAAQWELDNQIPLSRSEYNRLYPGKVYSKFFTTVQTVEQPEFIIRLGDLVYVIDDDPKISQYFVGKDGRKKKADKIKVKFGLVLSIRHIDSPKEVQNVYIHVQWLAPGCDTILQEMASMKELFLTNSCDDILADVVYGTGRLTPFGVRGKRVDFNESMASKIGEDEYFVRFVYDYQDGSFKDLGDAEQLLAPRPFLYDEMNPGYCNCCRKRYEKEKFDDKWLVVTAGGSEELYLHQRSKEWYIYANEYIYIQPPSNAQPGTTFGIGYIKKITNSSVLVEHMARVDDVEKEDIRYKDPRHIYFTGVESEFPLSRIIRKCFVFFSGGEQKAKAKVLRYGALLKDVYFYENRKEKGSGKLIPIEKMLPLHKQTFIDWEARIEIERHGAVYNRKLKGLDIFAGCGGLTVGLDMSGAVETKWAIEFAPSAANTLALNFPDITVYNECANVLLSRAIQVEKDGLNDEARKDLQGRELPHLPNRGEVDFIYGGPPCQGFSGINRYKKGNDIKNSLVATFLSYVDHYRPRFVLLENVKGLITTKLGSGKNAEGKWEGGISNGVVKFIYRTLISMNYQCRIGLVQSGEYGVPQSRPRVIFLAAKVGEKLPDLPEPMHAFEVVDKQYTLPHIVKYHTTKSGIAPLPRITIGEAVSDLPQFQYANPKTWPAHDPYRNQPPSATIDKFSVSKSTSFVGYLVQPYSTSPKSEFQRRLRTRLIPSSDPTKDPTLITTRLVTAHVTRLFNKETTQRVLCVPMYPGADHRNLPSEMRPWCLIDPKSQAEKHRFWPGLFGRLSLDDFFSTALTDVQPCGKQGKVLHPTQRRVYTVRELARAQGFPDWFAFTDGTDGGLGGVKEWHRHIGNAVPIPLGEAIGREIGYAVWWRDVIERMADDENEEMGGVDKVETVESDMPGNAREFWVGGNVVKRGIWGLL